jgi:hypothetical protein
MVKEKAIDAKIDAKIDGSINRKFVLNKVRNLFINLLFLNILSPLNLLYQNYS